MKMKIKLLNKITIMTIKFYMKIIIKMKELKYKKI